ncbi:IS1595 family transposase [Thiohalorhabdus methylotrophus]|uniref:IS1595 family transposase n=1 Tax=Thiohalorhabdus methylotrophus TaxID=3242694 RepID=A0ABV4TYZ6_9GAMM
MGYPSISFFEFSQRFATEEACAKALERMRWPDGFVCPRCEFDRAYALETRPRWRQCARCGHQVSLTNGTVFHRTRTPLVKWFWAIYLMSRDKGGISARRLSKELELRYETAWLMLQKLRKAMADRDRRYQLQGLIEADEAFFGGPRPGTRGRGAANKTTVLVMAEDRGKRPGFVAMAPIEDFTAETTEKAVKAHVAKEQAVRTDGGRNFATLAAEGYAHDGAATPPKQASERLPWVHLAISLAKRTVLGTFHGVSHKHLTRYLSEFTYRFNRRWKEDELPFRLLNACVNAETITYAELTG